MSTYVIGDVHACYEELKSLLCKIEFNPSYDKIIFVGDLIGRGPKPCEVLELIMDFGDSVINVLGNHDLRFLAAAHNLIPVDEAKDLASILESSHLDKYIAWFSSSKLLHVDELLNIIVVHAAIPPCWDIQAALKYENFFHDQILINGYGEILKNINSNKSLVWHPTMTRNQILHYIVFGFTKLKFCYQNGAFDDTYQGAPGQQPSFLKPWFLLREELHNDKFHIIFGHWSALELFQSPLVTCCDSGCVYGGKLTAIKIDLPRKIYQTESRKEIGIRN